MNCEKNSTFCSVTMYHPTVASPKQNLSNPALTERNIQKPTLIFYALVRSNTLWSIIALYRVCTSCLACQHFEFNSADLFFSQWERNLTARCSRHSWGKNAWRTPTNVCVGGYRLQHKQISLKEWDYTLGTLWCGRTVTWLPKFHRWIDNQIFLGSARVELR